MKCAVLPLNLKLKREFVVAGGRESMKRNYLVLLDYAGLGEAAGSVHYGVSPEEVERDLMRLRDEVSDRSDAGMPELLMSLENELCPPALCAFSTAWHDLQAKRAGKSLHSRFDLPAPGKKATSVTVSVGDMEAWESCLRNGYECLKIKLSDDESWNTAAVDKMNADTRTRYRIDANSGWNIESALDTVNRLPTDRIDLIEQPFAADDLESWKRLGAQTPIPLFMDESIECADDVKRAADYVDGVNIKIQKSGRLERTVAALRAAREAGMKIMMGCMIESSVGIATALQLSGMADVLDLDGRLLIERDPFTGLGYDGDEITVEQGYGHGISLA